ncbi:MAG: exosome complex exonuclease Rrp41 [Candidatus Aenigmatarchaeota archaeon]
MKKENINLIIDGKRSDGRKLDEIRDVKIELGIIPLANGSAKFSFGNTIAIASVYGARELQPKFLQEEKAITRVRYNMAAFSTDTRKNPGMDRRSIEISKVLKDAIENSIFLEEYPRATIDCYVEVISSDGSTRVTSLNAISLSLAMAGISMKDLIVALTAGKIDGKIVLDLNQLEDNNGDADISFGYLFATDEIVLLQMDGNLTKDEFLMALNMLKEKAKIVYEKQRDAIKKYFEKNDQ